MVVYHDESYGAGGGSGGSSAAKKVEHAAPKTDEVNEKAAAYDALLDALGDDMDRRLAEINATLDRLAA